MSIVERIAEAAAACIRLIRVSRQPSIGCHDCPIVFGCALEPQPRCLARVEAVAAGRRHPRVAHRHSDLMM